MEKQMIALAMAAHPDDIEFMMGGTLLFAAARRRRDPRCATSRTDATVRRSTGREEAARVRALEAQASARVAGAVWHPSLFDDTQLFYDSVSLAKVTAVVREVRPDILLTTSRYDYMEDHEYAARLACSAAFNRCLPAYVTDPLCRPATSRSRCTTRCPTD
jgi:LmbE family N-acetylglucosaminyl deacetylase